LWDSTLVLDSSTSSVEVYNISNSTSFISRLGGNIKIKVKEKRRERERERIGNNLKFICWCKLLCRRHLIGPKGWLAVVIPPAVRGSPDFSSYVMVT